MKQFKSLDEQIDYLHNNKNIEFRDRGIAKRNDGVFDNNYRKKAINFIFQLNPDTDKRVLLNGIMAHSDHFVKIKNSQSRSND